MSKTPIGSAGFNARRTPINSLSNRPNQTNSGTKPKSKSAMEEERLQKPSAANFFDSSDDDDGFNDLLAKNADKKKLKNDEKLEETQDKLTFEIGDFVKEASERIEDKYFFMKDSLGVGLFGTVYKARHKENGQIRAVKKIRKDHQKAKDIETLLKDVEILKKLDHPNIIKVYEFYQD